MKEIIRSYYLDKIIPFRSKHLIKVLVGQRRVGKTTILKQIASSSDPTKILQINMEQSDVSWILSDTELTQHLESAIEKGVSEIYIDEVQMIKNWEIAINSIFSKYPNVDIFLTGSNSELLSSELTTLLRGRYISFEIFPFSYDEFCLYFEFEKDRRSWQRYMELGTTPINYMLDNTLLVHEWMKNLVSTIFLKDIVERYKIKDVHILEEVFLFFVNNIGNNVSLTSIMRTLASRGVSTNLTTLGNYVEYLKNTFLIYEAPLYDLRGKQVFNRERKLYLSDPLYRKIFFSGYDAGVGKILENLIFLEAKRRGYSVYVGRMGDMEIDFVIEREGVRKYIQVAYLLSDEDVIKREFGNLKAIPDSWEKYVISLDEISFGIIDGIKHVQAWDMESIF
ncbi:MAG: ATP-binding protein [Candidatus Gracilibacteria bacterium]|nr:ATP-binding protein [Candidatus Gracilibacteria bacterium]